MQSNGSVTDICCVLKAVARKNRRKTLAVLYFRRVAALHLTVTQAMTSNRDFLFIFQLLGNKSREAVLKTNTRPSAQQCSLGLSFVCLGENWPKNIGYVNLFVPRRPIQRRAARDKTDTKLRTEMSRYVSEKEGRKQVGPSRSPILYKENESISFLS